jgi:hypothetical protein
MSSPFDEAIRRHLTDYQTLLNHEEARLLQLASKLERRGTKRTAIDARLKAIEDARRDVQWFLREFLGNPARGGGRAKGKKRDRGKSGKA